MFGFILTALYLKRSSFPSTSRSDNCVPSPCRHHAEFGTWRHPSLIDPPEGSEDAAGVEVPQKVGGGFAAADVHFRPEAEAKVVERRVKQVFRRAGSSRQRPSLAPGVVLRLKNIEGQLAEELSLAVRRQGVKGVTDLQVKGGLNVVVIQL